MPLDTILDDVHSHISSLLGGAEAPAEGTLGAAAISGTTTVDFTLDGNGNYSYQRSQYCAGVTISFTFTINNPSATYNISIQSSDGGGGSWSNIQAGQPVSGSLQTSFWHSTTFIVNVHASVTNQSGSATIQYST